MNCVRKRHFCSAAESSIHHLWNRGSICRNVLQTQTVLISAWHMMYRDDDGQREASRRVLREFVSQSAVVHHQRGLAHDIMTSHPERRCFAETVLFLGLHPCIPGHVSFNPDLSLYVLASVQKTELSQKCFFVQSSHYRSDRKWWGQLCFTQDVAIECKLNRKIC